MKWITHQVSAVGAALVLSLSPFAVAAAWAGAVLPDVVDQKRAALSRNRQREFNRIHRGSSHWFGWWLALWLVPLTFPSVIGLSAEEAGILAGVGFGALTHVLLDMCTTAGIPLLPWSRKGKFSLKLCRTGGVGEYLYLAVAVALTALLAWRALPGAELAPGHLFRALSL